MTLENYIVYACEENGKETLKAFPQGSLRPIDIPQELKRLNGGLFDENGKIDNMLTVFFKADSEKDAIEYYLHIVTTVQGNSSKIQWEKIDTAGKNSIVGKGLPFKKERIDISNKNMEEILIACYEAMQGSNIAP